MSGLYTEPYQVPDQAGQAPWGRDSGTVLNGGGCVGAPWNADWRGEQWTPNQYQGYGGLMEYPAIGQPTDWSTYSGRVDVRPEIYGYAGPLQNMNMSELRAGSTIGFPLHGQTEPGFDPVLLELPHDSSADYGWQLWEHQGQRMLFQEPPTYGEQTAPMPAAGWP
jgi:hypothetical protein